MYIMSKTPKGRQRTSKKKIITRSYWPNCPQRSHKTENCSSPKLFRVEIQINMWNNSKAKLVEEMLL